MNDTQLSVFMPHADGIIAIMKTLPNLSPDVTSVLATTTPGSLSGILGTILPAVITVLTGCIPVALTPAHLVKEWEDLQVVGFIGKAYRTRLRSGYKKAITKEVGTAPDDVAVMNAVLTPLRDATVIHVKTLTETDAAAMIAAMAAA